MTDSTAIRLLSLAKSFNRRRLLDEIDIGLDRGRLQLLSGPNGSGKSTLLRILAGLEKPDHGRVDWGRGEVSWRKARRHLQDNVLYLHQTPYMFDGDIHYNLRFALPRRMPRQQVRQQIERAIAWADLGHLSATPAKRLSGGERQRVALARAWLRRPQVLLLDEPTSNMDQLSRQRTLQLLESLKAEGMALLIASHDPSHFESLQDLHLHLHHGKLAELDDSVALWPRPTPQANSLRLRP